MKNLTVKQRIGIKLMKEGANLFFADEHSKILFRNNINAETWIGSMAESGGYIHAHISPMCEFDTQSVINVLRHWGNEIAPKENELTEFKTYYKEEWK